MQIHEDAAKLRSEIEASFADVPYPGDENIVSCNRGLCFECKEIQDFYRGKNWREVPNSEFWTSLRLMQAGTLLSNEAFRFYLPALMMASLEVLDYQDHTSAKAGEVLSSLMFNLSTAKAERLNIFNSKERSQIIYFLRFLKGDSLVGDDEDIDRAIDLFSG